MWQWILGTILYACISAFKPDIKNIGFRPWKWGLTYTQVNNSMVSENCIETDGETATNESEFSMNILDQTKATSS